MASLAQQTTTSDQANGTIIELQNVRKRFAKQTVLDGISVSLRQGETNVIIGASGVGKSVLIKHIVGLLKPDSGKIFYKGMRIDDLSDKKMARLRSEFGYLFQLSALFDSMTAGKNVAFPLEQRTKKSHTEIDHIVREKLRMVGLENVIDKMPSQLSGGQKKRVALARAIALNPKVILYDEPTTGLDPVRADVINELILTLQREMSVTSIVVTHDMASVYKVADRVMMLFAGSFIFDGSADELRNCSDPRVQRFIEGRASEEDLRILEGDV
jgi:phospholipid/cholesterol/gamma-HCH transport system ATP-binding protein